MVSTMNRKKVVPPMHQVYDRAIPCLRTLTGWRWRKKLVSITTTRFRRSVGIGWRKTLFQTCESVIFSTIDMVALGVASVRVVWLASGVGREACAGRPAFGRGRGRARTRRGRPDRAARVSSTGRSRLDEAVGVGPLTQLLLELLALVDDDLPVVGHGDLEPFQRARGGALEVD